jgi:hypothetical protein
MIIWKKLIRFIIKRSEPELESKPESRSNTEIIGSWKNELTPEHEKREIETRTNLQRYLVDKMRSEMSAIVEEHKTKRQT